MYESRENTEEKGYWKWKVSLVLVDNLFKIWCYMDRPLSVKF